MYTESFNDKPHILILGAGIAGLTAAYHLRNQNVQVLVLEARNRVGGRLDTRRVDGTDLTYELGGEWIGKDHEAVQKLCEELGIELIDHMMNSHLLLNHIFSKAGKWGLSPKWGRLCYELMHRYPKLPRETIVHLDAIDWWNFMQENKLPERDMQILDIMYSNDFGESTRYLSAYAVLTHIYYEEEEEFTSTYRIKGGNNKLITALVEKIGEDTILMNNKVDTIYNDEDGITVACRDGKLFKADYLINTLPTSVLTQLQWQPHLPQEQQFAVHSTAYNRVIKSAFIFKNRFWPDDDFQILSDSLISAVHHATKNQDGIKGVLTATALGEKAEIFAALTDNEKKKYLNDLLEPEFGSQFDNIEEVVSHDWTMDTMVRGGYSVFRNATKYTALALLQQPYRNNFFAGEHTSDMHGFMEGAVDSGERAAKQVIQKIKENILQHNELQIEV